MNEGVCALRKAVRQVQSHPDEARLASVTEGSKVSANLRVFKDEEKRKICELLGCHLEQFAVLCGATRGSEVTGAVGEGARSKRGGDVKMQRQPPLTRPNLRSVELVYFGYEVKKPALPPFKFLVVRSLRLFQ